MFSWFSLFSSFLCFSLVCVILVIIKVKDAARIDTAFAKVFVSNSLCYCEFLVSWPKVVDHDFGNLKGDLCTQFYKNTMFSCLGLSAMGPQELIKHMTSRPGPPTSRTHFVFGIERSASTERPLPGEAFSLAEKIGAPSRPENRDFMRFTGLTGLAWHIAKHSKKERILPFNFARNSSIHRTMRRSCVLGFRSWWFWETLGAPGTYKTQDFEARPFDIESALCLWNRAFCFDRTTISWRGIFFRRKNL